MNQRSAPVTGCTHVGQLFSIKNNMIIIKGKIDTAPIGNGNLDTIGWHAGQKS